jgi:zinc transporter, ZIP family
MLMIKFFAEKLEKSEGSIVKSTLPIGMLAALGIDLLVDGLLLGVGFAAGKKEGILLSVALAVEIFALGLSVTLTCRKNNMSRRNNLVILGGLGLTFLVGSTIGITVLADLSKELLELVLSFRLAALLFLVTEELLTEAQEEEETLLQTSAFFAGFLLFLIVRMVA